MGSQPKPQQQVQALQSGASGGVQTIGVNQQQPQVIQLQPQQQKQHAQTEQQMQQPEVIQLQPQQQQQMQQLGAQEDLQEESKLSSRPLRPLGRSTRFQFS